MINSRRPKYHYLIALSRALLLSSLFILPSTALASGTNSSMEFSTSSLGSTPMDPFGSGAAGLQGSAMDSNLTGAGQDRAMEVESTKDFTTNQQISRAGVPYAGSPTTLQPVNIHPLDRLYAQGNGSLPPTNLDSFVRQAGGKAYSIYGDEGIIFMPPMFGFGGGSRINSGISGQNAQGLTTGHQDPSLPEAWGRPN